jgi:hypothetical protein
MAMEPSATPDFDNALDDACPDEIGLAIARQVEALRAQRPQAPLLSIFDLAVESRRGSTVAFGDLLWLDSDDTFVDLVMEAFCPQSEGHKQLAKSDDPEDQGRAAELEEFRDLQAAAAFFRRYELNGHRAR